MFDWLFGSEGIEFGSDAAENKSKAIEFRIRRIESKLDLILNHLGIELSSPFFDVILISDGGNKLDVVKVIRDMTGCSLKNAKEIVEGVPVTVVSGILENDASTVQSELEAAGATVEIRMTD